MAALATVSVNEYPQTSAVWFDAESDVVRVNTKRGFAKERNMLRDPPGEP